MMRGELPQHQAQQGAPAGDPSLRLKNPNFVAKLEQMKLTLCPLVRLDNGTIHPAFPSSVLQYWLLTDDQCEAIAHFYHQRSPSPWSAHYPCPITWDSSLPLEQKRRKIGRFMGLQGCDSPIRLKTEEDITEDARRARYAEEEAIWRGKGSLFRG